MSSDDAPSDPITGICIVADPYKCPPRYDLLYKSWDRKDDCDLWKDGMFRAKISRYVCVTRANISDSGHTNEVLSDIVIQNERDLPPPGYQLIERTKDSLDKATNKKQLCVRMVERHLASEAITDVIILSRNKRAPTGYTLAGEINNLVVCYRLCSITPSQQPQHQPQQQQQHPQQQHQQSLGPVSWPEQPSSVSSVTNGQLSGPRSSYFEDHIAPQQYMRQDSGSTSGNPLAEVPFALNPRLADPSTLRHLTEVHSSCFTYKSLDQLENEFSYAFSLEKTSAVLGL